MKKNIVAIFALGIAACTFQPYRVRAQSDASTKKYYNEAKDRLEAMLDGKTLLSYEQAIFTIENAYWDNQLDSTAFFSFINYSADIIRSIARSNTVHPAKTPTKDLWGQLQNYRAGELNYFEAVKTNWAIYTFMTDTIHGVWRRNPIYKAPYKYSTNDPFGTIDWSNTQVNNLLERNVGNCFALTSLFKIFSEQLHSDADICTAPGHVYITHRDEKGTYYNVEVASRSFPGTGTMETLTYTTDDAIKNNISLRQLNLKQSVALCLVYLAKGYEYKFKIHGGDFALQCANLAMRYDPGSLNAMLLKAEALETALLAKHKSAAQLQSDRTFSEYQRLLAHMYALGYREMPVDMKNFLVKHWMRDKTHLSAERSDHTEKVFGTIDTGYNRYASLSWGAFDENIRDKAAEKYGRTVFDTRKRKIAGFVPEDALYNDYNFDPVIFALNVDPLAHKYPSLSPYSAFANSPIYLKDEDGREPTVAQAGTTEGFIHVMNYSPSRVGFYTGTNASNYLLKLGKTEFNWKQFRPLPTETYYNTKQSRYIYTEKGGWIDMSHFMFYAGRAYQYKVDGEKNPVGEAVQFKAAILALWPPSMPL